MRLRSVGWIRMEFQMDDSARLGTVRLKAECAGKLLQHLNPSFNVVLLASNHGPARRGVPDKFLELLRFLLAAFRARRLSIHGDEPAECSLRSLDLFAHA